MARPHARLIVLTSGWSKPDWAWAPIENFWKDNGYDVIRATYPGRGFQPIEETAATVESTISAVRRHYDHITFIGHSMGGLIGRYIVANGNRCGIEAYVSLGSPHNGTHLAGLGAWFSRSAAQMRRGSDFLRELHDCGWDPSVPALAIQAGLEEVVLPRVSAEIDFGENVRIRHATHASLLVDSRVNWEVWGWLTYDVFGEPGPLARQGYSSKVA